MSLAISTPARGGSGAPQWSHLILPGPDPVPVQIYRPAPANGPPAGFLVRAHGGSWRHGSATEWHHATATLVERSGWTVISVDYRLAPQHRHPRAVHDVGRPCHNYCG
ncbi:alpha/beta hydrolase [Microtetraspora malaysiensis]|uniref:alpha/beta hydrolase n=1 Tax=Microtetraspora malaysiensis TaxID=161358 RepID=UPI003D8E5257